MKGRIFNDKDIPKILFSLFKVKLKNNINQLKHNNTEKVNLNNSSYENVNDKRKDNKIKNNSKNKEYDKVPKEIDKKEFVIAKNTGNSDNSKKDSSLDLNRNNNNIDNRINLDINDKKYYNSNNSAKNTDIFKSDDSMKKNSEYSHILPKSANIFKESNNGIEEAELTEKENNISSKKEVKKFDGGEECLSFGRTSSDFQQQKKVEINNEEHKKNTEDKKQSTFSNKDNNNYDNKEIKEKVINSVSTLSKNTKVALNDTTKDTIIDNFFNNEEEKVSEVHENYNMFTSSNMLNLYKRIGEELKKLKGGMEELKNSNKKKDEEIEILNEKIKNMEKSNDMKDVEINQLKIQTNSLKNEIESISKEIDILQQDMNKIKKILGTIQGRNMAKSLLIQFEYLLTEEDMKRIEISKKYKWKIIEERIEKALIGFKENPKYKSIIEIFRKSLILIDNGNAGANSLNLDIYQNEIYENAKRHKLLIEKSNQINIFFLSQLGISNDLFMDGYNCLEKNFNAKISNPDSINYPIEMLFK